MKAYFKYPWLVIGNVAKIDVKGNYVLYKSGAFRVDGLSSGLIEFIGEAIKESEIVYKEVSECWLSTSPHITMEGIYRISFTVPCRLRFQRGNEIKGYLSVSPDGVVAELEVSGSTFEEGRKYEKALENKLLGIAVESRLGLPLTVARIVERGDVLLFYDPWGNLALKITSNHYETDYVVLVGDLTGRNEVLNWLKRVVAKSLRESITNRIESGDKLLLENENLQITYDTTKKEVLELALSLNDLKIFKIMEEIRFSNYPGNGKKIWIMIHGLWTYWKELGKELWGFIRFLSF